METTTTDVIADPSIDDLRSLISGESEEKTTEAPAEPAKAETKTDPAPEPEKKAQPAATEETTPNVQKRIDKAVKAQREAERVAADAVAKLEKFTGSRTANDSAPAKEPQAEDFDTYTAYNKAFVRWEMSQAQQADAKAENEQAQKQAAEARGNVWKERVSEAKADHPDYDDVMNGAGELPVSKIMESYIINSEVGPKMAYALASQPEEAKRIHALTGVAASRALVALEAQFLADDTPAAKPAAAKPAAAEAPAKPAAKLPRPPLAVGGSHAPAEIDLNDPGVSMAVWSREFQKRLNNKGN